MRVLEDPGGANEPVSDRPEQSPELMREPDAALPATKPKRRFAPQLIEQTARSYFAKSKDEHQPEERQNASDNSPVTPVPSISISDVTQATREISIQPNDNDTSNTIANTTASTTASNPQITKPVRRFAPVPIETTFDSYRVANRIAHPLVSDSTAGPSPTVTSTANQQEPKKPKRRFAPQLIETSRRVRRASHQGPATKPTDKTDITPGTNHIYAPKTKRKHGAARPTIGSSLAHAVPGKPGDDDEAIARFTGPRRQRSIKPHPNTRRTTRANSYHPELDTILSSESGNSSEEDDHGVAAPALNLGAPALSDTHTDGYEDSWSSNNCDLRSRRESCDEEFSGYLLGIAAREAHRQRELEQAMSAFPNGMPPPGVEHFFFARDNSEDDLLVGDDEPPLRHGPSQLLRRKSTDPGWAVKEMRAHAERLAKMRAETCFSLDDNSDQYEITPPPEDPLWTTTARRESHDLVMGSPSSPFLPAQTPILRARLPPLHEKPYTPPPSTGLSGTPFGVPFAFQTGGSEDGELRKMRKAASPPMLGADLVFRRCPSPQYTRMEPNHPYARFDRREENRDPSGASGLWHGYCSAHAKQLDVPALQPPQFIHTPGPDSPAVDPFAAAFACSAREDGVQSSTAHQTIIEDGESEEALLAEFDDAFVTQVYNYLSLGYPATARAFDNELSKISGICIEELRRDDTLEVGKGFMLEMEMKREAGSTSSNDEEGMGGEERTTATVPAHDRQQQCYKPPRWEALKLYIHEWARQHPALNDDDDSGPPAWGVRARRGSWAI
ncbi:hypothetical protein F5Y17DRAFT_416652 [Xylariaceae sp. FL0594]|nr:hypothetical protein F5Y17DRAFT_416652 [Xylariaceae sp. FL0594]